jgi:NADH:ubiquinone oxidoreductase subunit 5 (subunit L)/multisubunit Na+/H+ antiporter MnhA subunit
VILAICAVGAGWLGWPHSLGGSDHFAKFLDPVFAHEARVFTEEGKAAQLAAGEKEEEHTSPEYGLMFLSVGAAVVGWGLAWRAYRNADKGYVEPIAAGSATVRRALQQVLRRRSLRLRLYRPPQGGRRASGRDGSWRSVVVVRLACDRWRGQWCGWITRFTGTLSSWFDKWIIDGVLVNGPAILSRMLSYPMRLLEWGLVQWYALVMVIGLVGFVAYYAWR